MSELCVTDKLKSAKNQEKHKKENDIRKIALLRSIE